MDTPSHPVHPGKVLFEQAMEPLGISREKLARDIDVPVGRINDIVNGKRGITPDTALRLGKYLGTAGELWMRLQAEFDLFIARSTVWREIEPRIRELEGGDKFESSFAAESTTVTETAQDVAPVAIASPAMATAGLDAQPSLAADEREAVFMEPSSADIDPVDSAAAFDPLADADRSEDPKVDFVNQETDDTTVDPVSPASEALSYDQADMSSVASTAHAERDLDFDPVPFDRSVERASAYERLEDDEAENDRTHSSDELEDFVESSTAAALNQSNEPSPFERVAEIENAFATNDPIPDAPTVMTTGSGASSSVGGDPYGLSPVDSVAAFGSALARIDEPAHSDPAEEVVYDPPTQAASIDSVAALGSVVAESGIQDIGRTEAFEFDSVSALESAIATTEPTHGSHATSFDPVVTPAETVAPSASEPAKVEPPTDELDRLEPVTLPDYGSLEALADLEFDESLLPPWPLLGEEDEGDPLDIPSPDDTPFPVDPFK